MHQLTSSPDNRDLVRINLPLFSTIVPSNILDGTTVENKGKLILTEIFPSVQKHDI